MPVRSVGVEEEFLLVDPETGSPRAVASTVLRAGDDLNGELAGELQAEQLETGTCPRVDLDEVGQEILTRRREATIAARRAGVEAVPLATYPLPVAPHSADDPRYHEMMRRFGPTAAEQLTCGCHVHVAVESDEEAVAVVDRIQPWLAVLLALSVNSPFWEGTDSGYGSYRSQVWGRWPSAGPTAPFDSAARYQQITEQLLRTDTLLDRGMLYFDARPSHHHPTVEVRVADVCREPRDALLLAALTRGLVETAAREWAAGQPTRSRPHRDAAPGFLAGGPVGDRRRAAHAARLAPGGGRGRRGGTHRAHRAGCDRRRRPPDRHGALAGSPHPSAGRPPSTPRLPRARPARRRPRRALRREPGRQRRGHRLPRLNLHLDRRRLRARESC